MWDEHLVKCHSVHLVCIHCRMYGLVVMLCFTTGTTSRNIDKVYHLDYMPGVQIDFYRTSRIGKKH